MADRKMFSEYLTQNYNLASKHHMNHNHGSFYFIFAVSPFTEKIRFCAPWSKKSYSFQQPDDRMVIFGWTIPL